MLGKVFLIALIAVLDTALALGTNCGVNVLEKYSNNLRIARVKPAVGNSHPSMRIALFGDQALTSEASQVLKMVKNWKADLVVHLGDFDYTDSPKAFEKLINDNLGVNYPYIAAVGNHDLKKWAQYQQNLIDRMDRIQLSQYCKGEYGVNMVCRFGDVLIVLVGVGCRGVEHAKFLDQALTQNQDAAFKICGWHKNQRLFQTGNKRDETGYEVYEICRKHGAIVATGHEHSYSRTLLLGSFSNQTMSTHRSQHMMNIVPGSTFAFVAGTAGAHLRGWKFNLEKNPWWAVTASLNNKLVHGALLCEFAGHSGSCEYMDINGKVWDTFNITTPKRQYSTAKITAGFEQKTLESQISSSVDVFNAVGDSIIPAENSDLIIIAAAPKFATENIKQQIPYGIVLTFRGIDIPAGAVVKSAHLQFYVVSGEPSDAMMKVTGISDVNLFSAQTNDSNFVEIDEVEESEVLSSHDIKDQLIRAADGSYSFVVTGYASERVLVAGMSDPCLSPSLFMQLE